MRSNSVHPGLMKRNPLIAPLLLLAVLPAAMLASPAVDAAEFRKGDRVELSGSFADNVFAAGGEVRAELKSTDDVFIAGGDISFAGDTRESLFMAGGQSQVRDAKGDLGMLAGGEVFVSRATLRELIAGAGALRLEQVRIADDLLVGAGSIVIDASSRVGGTSVIAGGDVTLLGQFAGSVYVQAGKLTIGPEARIEGDLNYRADQVEISPAARISGNQNRMEAEARRSPAAAFVAAIFFMLGVFLVPAILAALLPGIARDGERALRAKPFECLGKGLLAVIGVPVLVVLLLISVVGTPLGLAALPFLPIGWMSAWMIASFTIGAALRGWRRRRQSPASTASDLDARARYGWAYLGALAFSLLSFVPVLGWLIGLVAWLAGMGALFEALRARYRASRA